MYMVLQTSIYIFAEFCVYFSVHTSVGSPGGFRSGGNVAIAEHDSGGEEELLEQQFDEQFAKGDGGACVK